MNLTQLVSLAAMVAASTIGIAGCNTTDDSSQGTLSQEVATEAMAEEDRGKNAF